MQAPILLFDNGKITSLSSPQRAISAADRSFLYGEGLFETLRVYKGQLPFLREHLNRLLKSAKALGLPTPPRRTLMRLITALKLETYAHASVKVLISSTMQTNRPVAMATATPLSLDPQLYKNGVHAVVVHSVVDDPLPLCLHKTTNFLSKVLGRREAVKRGAWEGILLNPYGELAEGCFSNLFWVKQGELFTPSPAAGCLPGITRSLLLRVAKTQWPRFQCHEVRALPSTLRDADEIMLTNSVIEVVPVVMLDAKAVGKGKPGPIFKTLRAAYTQLLRHELR